MTELTASLLRSSRAVDAVLADIGSVTKERTATVEALEKQLKEMSDREVELQTRIETLKNVPLPVAEHFAALTAAGEKRSARRDYVLFLMGVLVSTLISVVFFLIQGR